MIAQIFPLETSHDAEGLSYFVPEGLRNIAIWQLVEIPLRDEITHGIVASLVEYDGDIPEEIRTVISIVFQAPVLDVSQVEAIREIAKTSVIHLHKVLALFLPKPVLHRMLKYGMGWNDADLRREISGNKPKLHFLRDVSALAAYSAELAGTRTTFIVPSDWYVTRIKDLLKSENLGIFSSELTETKRAQLWLDVRSWKFDTLIWTRRLCTYNLASFDRIVYLEDAIMKELLHSFHRYACLGIVEKIAKHANQELHVVSTTPSINVLAHTLASHFELINA